MRYCRSPRASGIAWCLFLVAACLMQVQVRAQNLARFRPPAVPLVTHDPYFSNWSMNDRLTDDWTKHWTGSIQAMSGLARIDGKPYNFISNGVKSAPNMQQTALTVTPTRSIYQFEAGGVHLNVTFMSPLLPDNLDVLSRPVTYVNFEASAIDGKPHQVALYYDATAEWAVNKPEQVVGWQRSSVGDMNVMRFGTQEQPVLQKTGDNLRIDWGYFYVAVPRQPAVSTVITSDAAREAFLNNLLPKNDDTRQPRAANDEWPVLATSFDLGTVNRRPVERRLMLAYDDLYSIQLFGKNLRPYWRRNGMDADGLLRAAERDYSSLKRRCAAFDNELMSDARRLGGPKYERLITLAYRQALAAHKLAASEQGMPLLFPKENFSNGCISTVDVIYPSAPMFLLLNPQLMKAMLVPVLDYSMSPRWKFPFAPHDLGTYPKANGQVYGGGERTEENQMPVEESGNLLILLAALAKTEGNADFVKPYWPTLTKWAQYLQDKGMDPPNQLCTDDFAGHLAHNTNLSVKAIVALGSYAVLCDMTGKTGEANTYRTVARDMASQWVKMADDGDHYRLAFDKTGTWSQKYNLVWDKLLGLNIFPADVARKELAFYQTKLQHCGLPLDNRRDYTKLDWEVWTATLAQSPQQWQTIMDGLDNFVNETPSRVPLTDWYDTKSGKEQGFQARSVVGGLYIKYLDDPSLWRKWAGRAMGRTH
ncbi:MAG: DUF4965 domain-containing protein [Abitibacteriaceae bacterium]|nr:DUF4965 domain-containing protein [Abditibacteriaceae bacterium]